MRYFIIFALLFAPFFPLRAVSVLITQHPIQRKCENFKEIEALYKKNQTPYYGVSYAVCLTLRGRRGEGVNLMYQFRDKNRHLGAAIFIANYMATNGSFSGQVFPHLLDEAIPAFLKILRMIEQSGYPHPKNKQHIAFEKKNQIELYAYYTVPALYFNKYTKGVEGQHFQNLLKSPSYKGNKNLIFFAQHTHNTKKSLEKSLKSAKACEALPKKASFHPSFYEANKEKCKILTLAAQNILPLEDKRLELINSASCAKDIIKCSEYQKLGNALIPMIQSTFKHLDNVRAR